MATRTEEGRIEAINQACRRIRGCGDIPVRFAVYDSNGDFRGYKLDNLWLTHKSLFQPHAFPIGGRDFPTHYILNLIDILNRSPTNKPKEDKYVVVEQVGRDGELKEGLMGYHLKVNEHGRYEAH